MNDLQRPKIRPVLGPDGTTLTLNNLPSPNTVRWVIRRKAEVVAAVHGGLLSIEEVCARYSISVDEYLHWEHLITQHGVQGLRTTRTQQYRGRPSSS